MKFPGEERFLIETYLRSLILFDFMEQPSGCLVTPIKNCSACNMVILDGGHTAASSAAPPRVHHGQGHLGHAGGWISGNREERQGAARPTFVV